MAIWGATPARTSVRTAERAITVSYETIRHWCRKFGTRYARRLKRREGRLGDTWYLDELFVNIQGQFVARTDPDAEGRPLSHPAPWSLRSISQAACREIP